MKPLEAYEHATCAYYSDGRCRSCALLGVVPGTRVASKESRVLETLTRHGVKAEGVEHLRIPAHPWGSRSKVKLSVTGTIDAPIIGIVRSDLTSEDLSNCPLTPPHIQELIVGVRAFIKEAQLNPYNIKERTGELKQIIVTSNHDASQGILRFVLRSTESVSRIRKSFPSLMSAYPWVRVVSCNIQPLPAAILEGPEEVILTEAKTIEITYNQIPLTFSPQSFMQVTHEVAEALYARAARYVAAREYSEALDLFCGVGGFSLSLASSVKHVRGVEFSSSAVESAQSTARRLSIKNASFTADDVERFLERDDIGTPDLVIANPPRRGLSPAIISSLKKVSPRTILYSSCNPETFARDIHALSDRYDLKQISLFDMFAMTEHCEVLGVLRRRA